MHTGNTLCVKYANQSWVKYLSAYLLTVFVKKVSMRNQFANSGFELSIPKAFGIVILYRAFILPLVNYAFTAIGYSQHNLLIQSLIIISGEAISNVFVIWLLLRNINLNQSPRLKISYTGMFSFKLMGILLLITAGYIIAYHNSIGILISKIPASDFIDKLIASIERDFEKNPYPFIISTCILTPIFEEILFRGIFLKGFLNRYKPPIAIVLSALVFGLFHLNIHQLINATIIGLFLAIVYYETNSLILCISIHCFNNVVPFRFFLIDHDDRADIGQIAIAVLFLVIGFGLLMRYLKKEDVHWKSIRWVLLKKSVIIKRFQ